VAPTRALFPPIRAPSAAITLGDVRPVDAGLEIIIQSDFDHGRLDQHLLARAPDHLVDKALDIFMRGGGGANRDGSRFAVRYDNALDIVGTGKRLQISFQRSPEIVARLVFDRRRGITAGALFGGGQSGLDADA